MKDKRTVKPAAARASQTFSREEKSAMRERAREAKRAAAGADGEADLLAVIGAMGEADRELAERIHRLIKAAVPSLESRTWYGMPAYAKDGNLICFFQATSKFKTRYATLGFSDKANLDEGDLWPSAYAVRRLGPGDEKRIAELVKRAAS